MTIYRLYGFKWLSEKRYALSRFCSVYNRVKYSGLGVSLNEIRPAGKEGGKDVRPLEADLLLRGNQQAAGKTAKQTDLAMGLPLSEYIEPSEKAV